MDKILKTRRKIYNYFQNNKACREFFFNTSREEGYVAYYTSMYLISDTAESLQVHRGKGFSKNPLEAYIEFWGVMQAIIIQQDSICELYKAIKGTELNRGNLTSWGKLRDIRNICAGHPVKKDRPRSLPVKRTFMGRSFGGYSSFYYEQWEKPTSLQQPNNIMANITHPRVELGKIIDEYEKEAAEKLMEILEFMKERSPII